MENLNVNNLPVGGSLSKDHKDKKVLDGAKRFFPDRPSQRYSKKCYTTQFCYQLFNQPLRRFESVGVLTDFSKDTVNRDVITPLFDNPSGLLYPTLEAYEVSIPKVVKKGFFWNQMGEETKNLKEIFEQKIVDSFKIENENLKLDTQEQILCDILLHMLSSKGNDVVINYLRSSNVGPQVKVGMILSKFVGDLNNSFLTDRNLPKEMPDLYRGVSLSNDDFIKLCCKTDVHGRLYYFDNGFVSFSKDKDVFQKFTKSEFLLHISKHIVEDKNNYLDMGADSVYKHESEVLMRPGTVYEIVGRTLCDIKDKDHETLMEIELKVITDIELSKLQDIVI
jgi:hypothetical protein